MSEWPIEQIPDHADQAVDRLTSQYEDATNLKNLIRIYGDRFQGLEDVAYALLTERWLDGASGEQLDHLGDIVGEPRLGRTDTEYRSDIKVRVSLNTSSGEPESAITLVQQLTAATRVKLSEYYPAAVTISTDGTTIPARLHQSVLSVIPAGVKLQMISIGEGIPFSFDSGLNTGGFGAAPNWTLPDLYPAFGFGADGFSLNADYDGFGADGETGGGVFWGADWGEEDVTRPDEPGGLVAVAIIK